MKRYVVASMAVLALTACSSEPPAPSPPPAKPTKTVRADPLTPYESAPVALSGARLSKKEKALLEDLEQVKTNGDFLTGIIDGDEDNYGAPKSMRVSFVRTDFGLNASIVDTDGLGVQYDSATGDNSVLRPYAVTAETQSYLDVLVPALTAWKVQNHYWPQTYWDGNRNEWLLTGNAVGRYNGTVVLPLPSTFESKGRVIRDGDGYFIFENVLTGETVKLRVVKGKLKDAVAVVNIKIP